MVDRARTAPSGKRVRGSFSAIANEAIRAYLIQRGFAGKKDATLFLPSDMGSFTQSGQGGNPKLNITNSSSTRAARKAKKA